MEGCEVLLKGKLISLLVSDHHSNRRNGEFTGKSLLREWSTFKFLGRHQASKHAYTESTQEAPDLYMMSLFRVPCNKIVQHLVLMTA